ncbi:hypothetical protein B0A50_08641 [Salinomyces thailandicus]|uniref:CFEM domain-containing protein n=1 Tax=Salinomyces thailandicus TaxID=706561 RepID=A0A4U0TK32_9PEZI|nr:hypothetical protein B0A50_08641 [Salinomyces thailandica]
MRPSTVALATLASFGARHAVAQSAGGDMGFPDCSLDCLQQAVGNTSCTTDDYDCRCSGSAAQKIINIGLPCLCQSDCTTVDVIEVLQNTNEVCESVLAESSQTYTPVSFGAGLCATTAAGQGGTGMAANAEASPTDSSQTTTSDSAGATAGRGTLGSSGAVWQGAAVIAAAGAAVVAL